jgi:hypothetical protein
MIKISLRHLKKRFSLFYPNIHSFKLILYLCRALVM